MRKPGIILFTENIKEVCKEERGVISIFAHAAKRLEKYVSSFNPEEVMYGDRRPYSRQRAGFVLLTDYFL